MRAAGNNGHNGWAPVLWVLFTLALSVAADLILLERVGIPQRVLEAQSRAAEQILSRQAAALDELAGARPGLLRAVLGLDAGQPFLRVLALEDQDGRVLTAVGPGADAGPSAARDPLSAAGATGGAALDPGVRLSLQPDQRGGLLRASLALAPAVPGRTGGRLYLELDLRAAEQAAWAQRLAPAGWLPWVYGGGLALALSLLSVPYGRYRRHARKQRDDAGLSVPAPGAAPPADGRSELTDLSALVNQLGQHCATQEVARQDAEARWEAALSVAGEGLWDWDLTTDRVFYSPRWKAQLGEPPEAIGDALDEWTSRMHPDDLDACRSAFARHQAGVVPGFECEFRLRAKDDAWRWFQCRGRITRRDPDGRGLRMIGTQTDLTERKEAERTLTYLVGLETMLVETSRTLLAAQPEAVDQVLDRVLGALARRLEVERACLYALSADGQGLTATHEWCAVDIPEQRLGADAVAVSALPRWMETLRHGEEVQIDDLDHLPEAWGQDRQVLSAQGVCAIVAVPLRVGAGLAGCVVAEMTRAPRGWREGEVRALRLLGDLIGAALERRRFAQSLMESRQRIEQAALFDPLTGLPNRVLLAERMRAAMGAAMAGGTELAVCSLDLDGFKSLNEAHGQEVGDLILQAVAARLRRQVRESDSVARLGGDEFALLLGGFEDPQACARVLDPLIAALGQPYQVAGQELRVTASAGVTLYPHDAADADTLLRHADHAMYRAKQRGRNRYLFFNPSRDRRARARHSQLEQIGAAIDGDELVLYYQPQVDMRRRRVTGAEGLVRWQHPQRGLLPPAAFIPLLAGTALQQRLDWWVVERGLCQLTQWREAGLDLSLSLNISARSVQCESFVHDLGERLARHPGLAPDSLSLEILESEALVDLEAVARVIEHCAGLGVSFALDDFGTGYSSLTYFRRLPAQVLKIDRTFVRDMLRSPDDRNIVEGVVGLARAFRREVIAEGVESGAHGLMLLRMGCDQAQGYGVAEPMPAALLPQWVAGYRFPPLWRLSPDFAWSGATLDLLSAESEYRDWVARLIRAVGPGAKTRPATLEGARGGFAHWYEGEGRRLYGARDDFRRLEPLHRAVSERGLALWAARDQGEPTAGRIADLVAARDLCIIGLQALQEGVLGQADAAG